MPHDNNRNIKKLFTKRDDCREAARHQRQRKTLILVLSALAVDLGRHIMTAPRILVVPGGTAISAVALANASIHKLVELYEERQADPNHPAPHTVVFLI